MGPTKRYQLSGSQFISQVLSDPDFISDGVIIGVDGDIDYAVVDPSRHPMDLWEKGGVDDYEATAIALNGVVFTNGPQMGDPKEEISKGTIYVTTGLGAIGGMIVGAVLLAGIPIVGPAVGGIGGAAAGGYLVYRYWSKRVESLVPFGPVHAPSFSNPGLGNTSCAWFGANDPKDFKSYQIGESGPVPSLTYVSGGLIAMVINSTARSADRADPNFNEGYAGMSGANGIAAWALVPVPPGQADIPGVLVITGSLHANSRLAGNLASIGSTAAVAMDGNKSAMFGSRSEMFVPEVNNKYDQLRWAERQKIQRYGFYCH